MARGHHAALPYKDAAAFMTALRARSALAARCLEFTILTAARSGEALEATWGEINVADKLWRVPADRMKAGVEHIAPLSDAALAVLDALRPDKVKPTDRIFSINAAPWRAGRQAAASAIHSIIIPFFRSGTPISTSTKGA